jgi:aqualysin 1
MTRRLGLLLGLFALVGLLGPGSVLASQGRYVVVLDDSVASPAAVAVKHERKYGLDAGYRYHAALNGYAATVPSGQLASLRADKRVAYVERDRKLHAAAQVLPWGIDRIEADLSSTLAGNGSGTVFGVNAYIIDTGIDTLHADLNVVGHVNFAGGKNRDCNGHGTHVSGTVGAKDNSADVVGAAPGVRLTGVKVLGCSGSGSTSGVIAGVDWVTSHAVKPAIANMSLGGSRSTALDTAVRNSAVSGIVYSLAAGNEGANACQSSPAAAGAGTNNGIITTAAANSSNLETSWSNYGSCVDIWAPGASILSTRRGGGTTTMSGTSMASPHVGGAAALYLSSHAGATASAVEAQLKADAVSTGTSKGGGAVRLLDAGGY